jgi:hypothetical protein
MNTYAHRIFGMLNRLPRRGQIKEDRVGDIGQLESIFANVPMLKGDIRHPMAFKLFSGASSS